MRISQMKMRAVLTLREHEAYDVSTLESKGSNDTP